MFSNEDSIGRMLDADYDKDKKEITATLELIEEVKIDELIDYELGELVNHKKFGMGIIFKLLKDKNYWVAFPDKKDERIYSQPCVQEVFNIKELEKFREN